MNKVYGVQYELVLGQTKKSWVREDIYQSFLAAHKTASDWATAAVNQHNKEYGENPYYADTVREPNPYYIKVTDNGSFYGIYLGDVLVDGYRVVEFNLVRGVCA